MFKASLSRVVDDYANGRAGEGADILYSDPIAFFRDAAYCHPGYTGRGRQRPGASCQRRPLPTADAAAGHCLRWRQDPHADAR
ncbi:MAG: hypothetical protein U5L11_10655 [Arhodomonas sp.]|nr:hypothetical protein [Arhodomonas sp.]